MPRLSIPHKNSTLLIGVTGHRDLLPKDWQVQFDESGNPVAGGYLISFVRSKLQALQQAHSDKKLLVLTGMAEGADLLVTLVAQQLENPIPFIAILATESAAFLANIKPKFTTESETARLSQDRQLCEWLLPKASQTVVCATYPEEPNYREVGITIARYADELLALWNGVDTGKAGGTWEVVRMARTGRTMTGKRLAMFRSSKKNQFQAASPAYPPPG